MISSKPSRFCRPFACLELGDQHVDGVDVGGGADLGDHDQVEPLAGLLDHVDHVAVHVVGVEAVDPHGQGLVAPVDLVERLDDVLARLHLLVGRHRVLEIEEHHVGGRARRLLEELRRAARHGQLGAVQPRRALLDDREAHGCSSSGTRRTARYRGISGANVTCRTRGAAPGQRMVRAHGRRQALGLNMGVDLRGRDVGVTKHRLHRAQIGAAGEQVAGEGVAQHVRRDARRDRARPRAPAPCSSWARRCRVRWPLARPRRKQTGARRAAAARRRSRTAR